MALRNTLNEVVEMVRGEAKLSTNTSRGIDHRDHIVRLIKRYYETLAEDYDWPHLDLKRENDNLARKALAAGQRLYDFPSGINPLKIERAWLKFDGFWTPLDYGINFSDYNVDDPDNDERDDPVRSWKRSGLNQFEVHPIPATDGETDTYCVGFEGQARIEQLTSGTSRLDMDGTLISLFASAEILYGNEKNKLGDIKGAAAASRLNSLKKNTAGSTRVAMGRGVISQSGRTARIPTYIRVR
jgi:hypothetical protein